MLPQSNGLPSFHNTSLEDALGDVQHSKQELRERTMKIMTMQRRMAVKGDRKKGFLSLTPLAAG